MKTYICTPRTKDHQQEVELKSYDGSWAYFKAGTNEFVCMSNDIKNNAVDWDCTEERTNIGRIIREAREKQGYTCKQFAERISITRANLFNIENANVAVNLDTLIRICVGLGIKITIG